MERSRAPSPSPSPPVAPGRDPGPRNDRGPQGARSAARHSLPVVLFAVAVVVLVLIPGLRAPIPSEVLVEAVAHSHPQRPEHARELARLEKLLNAGADPNAADESAESLLHCAVRDRDVELIRLLLAHGADPDLALRQQLLILQRQLGKRPRLSRAEKLALLLTCVRMRPTRVPRGRLTATPNSAEPFPYPGLLPGAGHSCLRTQPASGQRPSCRPHRHPTSLRTPFGRARVTSRACETSLLAGVSGADQFRDLTRPPPPGGRS